MEDKMSHDLDSSSLVSIIIPFYNVEDYIEKTLASIYTQVYKNIEVILIDDGSTDKSSIVAERYLSKFNFKYTLVRQKNSGVSAARNYGLSLASGDYVVFIDSDDLLSPCYIKQMYEHLVTNQIEMVISGFHTFVDDITISNPLPEKTEIMNSLEVMQGFLYGIIKISVCSLMVKRKLITDFGLKFAQGYRYSEDIHFVWRLLAHTNKVAYDRTGLYFYRMRTGSAMANINEARLDGMYLMQDLEQYFKNHCEDFAGEFLKYGVARWIWATMWQAACALPYGEFNNFCLKMRANEMMNRLKFFPDARVRFSAKVFLFSNYSYYMCARIAARAGNVNRF
jgi:glycosyltransferase involved in cell wall biosynthesis